MVIVTMTTVGFGDYVPYTTIGKIVTMITALWGAFIISLLIVSVNTIFTLSPKQKVAYTKLIRVRSAAKCIISAMRYHVVNRKLRDITNGRESQMSRITTYVNEQLVKKYWKSFEKRLKKFNEISKNYKISQEQTMVTRKLTKIESRIDNLEKMMVRSLRLLKNISETKERKFGQPNILDSNQNLIDDSIPTPAGDLIETINQKSLSQENNCNFSPANDESSMAIKQVSENFQNALDDYLLHEEVSEAKNK